MQQLRRLPLSLQRPALTTGSAPTLTFFRETTLSFGLGGYHGCSKQRFFLSDTAGVLETAQTTATLGLVPWWGMKQGSW